MTGRPGPVELVFGGDLDDRFAPIAEGIAAAGYDPRHRDGFVLVREVVELLRELAPAEAASSVAVSELVAFLHAAYLYWADGRCRVRVDRAVLDRCLGAESGTPPVAPSVSRSYYLELPSQRVWGEPILDCPVEPLDGCFVIPRDGRLDLVAVFGLHAQRDGFTVVDASGERIPRLSRSDGSGLFSPRLPGGAAAGLFQLTGSQELMELGYRMHQLLGPAGAVPGEQQVSLP
ncbi:MAG: hypothetical protein FJ206_01480 [Gemmatimonadetes bacterium]|nr:hypothetical protein [Gemmatimonadota bacterium]